MEVRKDWNKDSFICVGSEEGNTPTCRVLCTESNFVTFLKAYSFEENVELCNLSCKLTESKKFATEITKGRALPVGLDSLFKS